MKKKILSNISFNFIIQIISYIVSFFQLMYVTRVLQPELFGRASFVSNFVGYFVLLANLGMPVYAQRACAEICNNRKELSHVYNEFLSIKIILAAISTICLALLVILIPSLRANLILFAIYGVSVLLQIVNCDWLYKGLEKFKFLAFTSFICKVISFACIILFVKSGEDIITYAILAIIVSYSSNVVCFFMRGRFVDKDLHFTVKKKHFKPLLIFFIMSCAVSIYGSLDITMLGFMKTDAETGLYSVAAQGKNVLLMTGGLVWGAILPYATKLWKEGNRKKFEDLAAKSYVLVTAFQTLVAVMCFIFAKRIILIVGGADYIGATTAFKVLLLSLPPIAASNILGGQVLIPCGKEKRLFAAEIVGAVFNFVANLIVIPHFSIVGAACTTVASEIIVWLVCIYFCKKNLEMDFGFSILKKTLGRLMREIRLCLIKCESRIKGNKLPYYCPCCDTRLRKFIDGKYTGKPLMYNPARYVGIDQNVICPVCNALPRHRILVSWMSKNKDLLIDKKILYFAPEKSVQKWLGKNGISLTTADLYNDADLKLDIEDTGLNDKAYDVIVCNHVLEHVNDYKKALNELYRILNEDGMLIISFPVDTSLSTISEDANIVSAADCLEHFGQHDHRRIFGSDSKELLESFGFDAFEISGEENYCNKKIKPVIGPANYDYNVLWGLRKAK